MSFYVSGFMQLFFQQCILLLLLKYLLVLKTEDKPSKLIFA